MAGPLDFPGLSLPTGESGRGFISGVLTPGLLKDVQGGDKDALRRLATFNPQALEDFQTLQTGQVQAQKEQVTQERVSAIKRKGNIDQVLRGGPDMLRNNIAKLAAEAQDDPDFDAQELVELANLAVADPTSATQKLQDWLGEAEAEIQIADQILAPVGAPTALRVQSSDVLPDGSTVQVMTDGSTRVTDPQGRQLTGQARAKAVKTAQEFGVDIQTRRAGGRAGAVAAVELETEPTIAATTRAAEAAIKRSEAAFDKVAKIKENVNNIDEAIQLLDEGAQTGAVVGRLPSIRQSSIALDNLQSRLGLDVIGNTTFGALSESELKFALDTALPQKLAPPELKRWLEQKKDSQLKLSGYLEQVASFLGTPGNTTRDFIELQKTEQLERETPEQQRLIFDPATGQFTPK